MKNTIFAIFIVASYIWLGCLEYKTREQKHSAEIQQKKQADLIENYKHLLTSFQAYDTTALDNSDKVEFIMDNMEGHMEEIAEEVARKIIAEEKTK